MTRSGLHGGSGVLDSIFTGSCFLLCFQSRSVVDPPRPSQMGAVTLYLLPIGQGPGFHLLDLNSFETVFLKDQILDSEHFRASFGLSRRKQARAIRTSQTLGIPYPKCVLFGVLEYLCNLLFDHL